MWWNSRSSSSALKRPGAPPPSAALASGSAPMSPPRAPSDRGNSISGSLTVPSPGGRPRMPAAVNRFGQGGAEIDGKETVLEGEFRRLPQDHRHQPEIWPGALQVAHPVIFILHPAGGRSLRRHHQHARARRIECCLQRHRDPVAWPAMPLVEPDIDPEFAEVPSEDLNPGEIFTLVADEGVVERVHTATYACI